MSDKFELFDSEFKDWIENTLLWLDQEYSTPGLSSSQIYKPEQLYTEWDNSEEDVFNLLNSIALIINVPLQTLVMEFHDSGENSIFAGGSVLYLENDENDYPSSSIFIGLDENNKYVFSIDIKNIQSPQIIIGAVAYQLCYIKLLNNLSEDDIDNCLIEVAVVFFGFGIFNANNSFVFKKSEEGWGYRSIGYLKPQEWAYALAYLSFMKKDENPNWTEYLNSSIKEFFEKSCKYILDNNISG